MQAMIYTEYGSPDVLELKQVDKPKPSNNEVLIKVYAASINDWDWGLLQGKPFINKMMSGLSRPKRIQILGSDIAGIVEAAGRDVTQLKVGDQVFGDLCGCKWGGFAEYVCAPESTMTVKPTGMSFEQAAALPQAALLAMQGLLHRKQVKSGKQVLINGAGGGSGSFAIQIAKSLGAEVTGVDTEAKFELMKSLGADHVIDFTQENFTQKGKHYDLILDLMGHHSIFDYKRSLYQNGRYLMVGGCSSLIFQSLIIAPLLSMISNKKLGLLAHQPNKEMEPLLKLFENGDVVPVIDKCYPLDELEQAFKYFGERCSKGKVVIKIAPK